MIKRNCNEYQELKNFTEETDHLCDAIKQASMREKYIVKKDNWIITHEKEEFQYNLFVDDTPVLILTDTKDIYINKSFLEEADDFINLWIAILNEYIDENKDKNKKIKDFIGSFNAK